MNPNWSRTLLGIAWCFFLLASILNSTQDARAQLGDGYGSAIPDKRAANLDPQSYTPGPYQVNQNGTWSMVTTATRLYLYRWQADTSKPQRILPPANVADSQIPVPGFRTMMAVAGYPILVQNNVESSMGMGMGMSAAGMPGMGIPGYVVGGGLGVSDMMMSDGSSTSNASSLKRGLVYAFVTDNDPQDKSSNEQARIQVLVPSMNAPETLENSNGYFDPDAPENPRFVELAPNNLLPPFLTGDTPVEKPNPQAKAWSMMDANARARIATLVRLDIWIQDLRKQLSSVSDDEKALTLTQNTLKGFLAQEYDTIIEGQKADIKLLQDKISRLQTEVERRLRAKDRVVDFQVGQMVLEAQGLLKP